MHQTYFIISKKMDDDSLVVCSKCGNSPCLTVLMGDELLEEGRRFQGNNDVSCKQVRFRLYMKFTRFLLHKRRDYDFKSVVVLAMIVQIMNLEQCRCDPLNG